MKKIILLWVALIVGYTTIAQPLTSAQIDQMTERALTTFQVPGMAVCVIKDGKVVHSKGYGIRSLRTGEKTNDQTLFGIASHSKAYTATALAMLMDEGKLSWDDKVMQHIPEFRMYNPYVSDEFTIRDLLTHRSGLGLGAGDLMFWPDSNNFTVKSIIHNLRYLKPISGFRTKYDYDNLLYIVAGEIVTRVSGMPWEDFVEQRIMQPLGMTYSAASYERVKSKQNWIDPHAPVNGKITPVHRDWSQTANAAGGIYSNVVDQAKWVLLWLNGGRYGDQLSKRLFSEANFKEMWTPQTIVPVTGTPADVAYRTHFKNYALGWNVSDALGYKQVTHSGGLAGNVTLTTLLPELNLGIIVYTNQQSGFAMGAVTNMIKDGYLGVKGKDWIAQLGEMERSNKGNADKILTDAYQVTALSTVKGAALEPYTGKYADPWLGDVEISLRNGKLWFQSIRSPRLAGEMLHYKGNTLVVKWKDRSMDADAFAVFSTDAEGRPSGFRMKAISPLTDFSFDFHDLSFERK